MTLDVVRVRVNPEMEYRVVGVLNRGRGLLRRDSMLGSQTKYSTLNVIRPNQVVYSRLKAFEGAATVATDLTDEAYASQEFPTFTCGPDLQPEYFRLVTRTPRFWAALSALSKGMGGRRERVSPDDFLSISLMLPDPSHQARVVATIRALDSNVQALEAELDALTLVHKAMREELLPGGEEVELAELLIGIDAGRSPSTTGTPPNEEQAGVLKVSAVTPLAFHPLESKALVDESIMSPAMEVRDGDVLITRANTPALVGAACRVPPGTRRGLYLSDKTLRLRLAEGVDGDFLVEALNRQDARSHLSGSATGSSASMFNVSQSKIRTTPIPRLPLAEQALTGRQLSNVRRLRAALSDEAASLRRTTSLLLERLLDEAEAVPDEDVHRTEVMADAGVL